MSIALENDGWYNPIPKVLPKRIVFPFTACAWAIPLNVSNSFKISLHQKDFFSWCPGNLLPMYRSYHKLTSPMARYSSKRASFCVLRFKILRPPPFSLQTILQAASGGFLLLISNPLHKQSLLNLSILYKTVFSILKLQRKKFVMEVIRELTTVILQLVFKALNRTSSFFHIWSQVAGNL